MFCSVIMADGIKKKDLNCYNFIGTEKSSFKIGTETKKCPSYKLGKKCSACTVEILPGFVFCPDSDVRGTVREHPSARCLTHPPPLTCSLITRPHAACN